MNTTTTTTAARLGNIYRARLAARAAARISVAITLEDAARAAARKAAAARIGAIAKAASELYRAACAKDPAARGIVTWRESMRIAAADAKAADTAARVTLEDIRAALEDGTSPRAAVIVAVIRHMASKCPAYAEHQVMRLDPETAAARLGELSPEDAARMEGAAENGEKLRILAPGTFAAWMGTRESWSDSIEHITAEAWTRLPRYLDAAEPGPRAASIVMYRAVLSACKSIDREFNPHKRSRRTPEERAALELRMIGTRPTDPEAGAIAADIVHRAANTPEDLYILRMVAAGVTQTEIAAKLGKKQYQISRALDRIRDRAAAVIAG